MTTGSGGEQGPSELVTTAECAGILGVARASVYTTLRRAGIVAVAAQAGRSGQNLFLRSEVEALAAKKLS